MQYLNENFTQWLEIRSKQAQENQKSIQETGARGWYVPSEKYSVRKYHSKRFDTEKLQKEYLDQLKGGGGLAGEIAALRFQAGQISACERAFLLRHTTVPRLLAHGYNENVIETNGLYDKFMKDYPSGMVEQAKKVREKKTG